MLKWETFVKLKRGQSATRKRSSSIHTNSEGVTGAGVPAIGRRNALVSNTPPEIRHFVPGSNLDHVLFGADLTTPHRFSLPGFRSSSKSLVREPPDDSRRTLSFPRNRGLPRVDLPETQGTPRVVSV